MEAYAAAVETDVVAGLARWREWLEAGGVTTLFQSPSWLAAWYATLGAQPGLTPLLVSISRRADGGLLLALPLTMERHGRTTRIRWADLGVADYAAPLIMPDCPDDEASIRAMWQALRHALPSADLLIVEKMPETVGGRHNPLLQLRGVRRSALFGNPLSIGEDFDGWRYSREKTHRKELERSWRVFTRTLGTTFQRILDLPQAEQVMDALEMHQRRAIELDKGWSYVLDRPAYHDFYRKLLAAGLASGDAVLTALTAGDEVVAALLGLRNESGYAMVRIGNASGEWRHCSPGRLVIERTLAALHAEGVRQFDFTIGDYAYKRGFKPDTLVLYDLTVALSWRGLPKVCRDGLTGRLRAWLRRHPALQRRAGVARAAWQRYLTGARRRKNP